MDYAGIHNQTLKLDKQLCFPLYAASREVIRQYHPLLEPLGLTYTQYIVMLVLWEQGKISVKELGRRLYLDSGTLTPVLKSLEAKGFIRRYRFSEDERVLIAEITDAGIALRKQVLSIPEQITASLRLSKEESETLHHLLYKLLGANE